MLFKVAILDRRALLKREAERRAQEQREQDLLRLKKRVEDEERRVRKLEQEAEDWTKAKKIREYLLAVLEEKKKLGDELGPDTPLGIWVSWALQHAACVESVPVESAVARPAIILAGSPATQRTADARARGVGCLTLHDLFIDDGGRLVASGGIRHGDYYRAARCLSSNSSAMTKDFRGSSVFTSSTLRSTMPRSMRMRLLSQSMSDRRRGKHSEMRRPKQTHIKA